jgi:hypothetical protein
VDLLDQTYDWLDDDSATRPRVLWLNGLAGTGKTTIARTVASTARERGVLAASFFFSRDHQERRRLASIVPTIAYQLALWRDELRTPICDAVFENINIADQLMAEQVDTLLIRSFEKHPLESIPSCALIVLDALDECDKENRTEGGDLLPLLIQSLSKIPFPVKVFVTSRPESSIRTMMNEPEMSGPTNAFIPKVFELHAVAPNIVAADIGLYLTSEFKRIAPLVLAAVPGTFADNRDKIPMTICPYSTSRRTSVAGLGRCAAWNQSHVYCDRGMRAQREDAGYDPTLCRRKCSQSRHRSVHIDVGRISALPVGTDLPPAACHLPARLLPTARAC